MAAVETITTINALCRLSKILYGSVDPVAGGGVSAVGEVLSGSRLSFDVDDILALVCYF